MMKQSLFKLFALLVCGVILQGCIALPPIVNVERKDGNSAVSESRLDSIEKRIERMEQKLDRR